MSYHALSSSCVTDKFRSVSRPIDKPLRICVSDVFKGMGSGFSVTGKIASGCVQIGDRVLVMPAAEYAMVKGKTEICCFSAFKVHQKNFQ